MSTLPSTDFIKANLTDARDLLEVVLSDETFLKTLQEAMEKMSSCFKEGGKILSCGNGGSMCDAMHFAEELSGRYWKNREPLPAMAISDPGHMSCVANDFGYSDIFSRTAFAFLRPGDMLLAISTSGQSENVLKAVDAAKDRGALVIGLLGKGGGPLKEKCDFPLVVPSHSTGRIQEIHIKLIHLLIEGVERVLYPEHYNG